jgi:hypothetical protein
MVEPDSVDIQLVGLLEDTVDKLQISGQIMPLTYEMRKNARQILNDNIADIQDNQSKVETEFGSLVQGGPGGPGGPRTDGTLKSTTSNLKTATHSLNRAFKQNPLGGDIFEKMESDRLFLEEVLCALIRGDHGGNGNGRGRGGGLESLKNSIMIEKNNKIEFQQIIKREEESKLIINRLQHSLVDIKQEKEVEIQKRNELIAHLKDRLQELKAKTNMEAKYVKKSTDNSVGQTKKKCDLSENDLRTQIEKLTEQIDEENRCNAELESFLKSSIAKMKQLTDNWSEKSDKETMQKQVDLDNLKTARTKDLERYQHLAKLFSEYEKVVVDDRLQKDEARIKAEQEKIELEASFRIQLWWKGQMLRHKLGPYGKKKKGKKGKKGKKKKK